MKSSGSSVVSTQPKASDPPQPAADPKAKGKAKGKAKLKSARKKKTTKPISFLDALCSSTRSTLCQVDQFCCDRSFESMSHI